MAARLAGVLALWLAGAMPAAAAACGGDFAAWLTAFRSEAAAAGISAGTLNLALSGLTPDSSVLALDRKQGYFKQSFEKYRSTRVTPGKVQTAIAKLRQNPDLFARIERQFGVPAPVLIAIWGLETGFGAGTGNTPAIRSLATLAQDCRRSAFFTNELIAALQIVERHDLTPQQMRGGWAGEIGQTQFLPSSYVKFAVDYDGDGRRDLIRSSADALASTANYLKGYGWRAGQPWGEGSANFQVLHQWHKADVYCRTIVWFAQQIEGAG
jgi:lytic murein transglycosylase